MHFGKPMRIFYLAIIALFPALVSGQYYNLGQDPSSLKWRQINTPHFHLVYPVSFEEKARKMIPTLDFIYKNETKTLAFKPEIIPFIVHNYTIVPNAVTVWAPKRVEFYACPPQDSYAQDWLSQLMIHEYRHVIQLDRTNQGFTKVLSWFTGEQAAALINGLFVPPWFMEGDAVCAETALSRSGRGRIPSFEMLLRAQVEEVGAFSYDKAAFGSYKTFVPDKYVLGYSLVASVRRRYGYQAWITALDEVARKPFILTPFNHGLKVATGYGKVSLYQKSMQDMDSLWRFQDANTSKTAVYQLTNANTRQYRNYKYPHFLNDSLLVSELTSMDDITRFVISGQNGFEKTITTPGFLSSDFYSIVTPEGRGGDVSAGKAGLPVKNFLIAWTETINDPRWQQRSFSVIRIYNSETGKTRMLTKKSRYFAPAFSPDGLLMAVVKVDPSNRSAIVLLDAATGKEKEIIIMSDSDFYMTPSWSKDGKELVFTKLDSKGKSINTIDLERKKVSTIVQATFTEISNPVFAAGNIFFNGSYSGIENVYAVDLLTKEIFQVTSSGFGACNAVLSPDGKQIAYSDYSSTGYSLVATGFNPGSWKRLNEIRDFSPKLYEHLAKEENSMAELAVENDTAYKSETYNKAAHIFNFHSWAPAYINYMAGEYGTGISFMSQNELSTATTTVGYLYDIAENTGKVTGNFSWQAWYPVIDFNASYGARTGYTNKDTSVRYNFNETIISGGFTLPLIFTGGKYYKGLELRVHTSLFNITDNTSPAENKLEGTINSLDYSMNAYRFIKQSVKDIYPRWGQVINGTFRHSPFGDNNYGSIASVGSRFYFPGLFPHHGVKLEFNWQKRNPGSYYYPSQINLPRGYYTLDKNAITCFAVNYKFPCWYPDLSFGPLAYFKRIKANLFYDGGTGKTDEISQKMQSAGVEITADLHLLRFVFPLDMGFRFGYLPIENKYFTDFLFSVNLSN